MSRVADLDENRVGRIFGVHLGGFDDEDIPRNKNPPPGGLVAPIALGSIIVTKEDAFLGVSIQLT